MISWSFNLTVNHGKEQEREELSEITPINSKKEIQRSSENRVKAGRTVSSPR